MTQTDIVREYVDKFPQMPNLKLARIIYKDHNLTFNNVDAVRSIIRGVTGKRGAKNTVAVTHPQGEKKKNPYNLPDSDETAYEPYRITGKRIAVFSDIHFPYHSIDALTAAITYCKKEKPDVLLLNGDVIDCHLLSRFVKDPKQRSFAGELDTMKAGIEAMQKQLKCRIIFKIGNHEERYNHFLLMKAHELDGVEEFELENIIKKRVECEFVTNKRIMKAGGLNIIHGHEFVQGMFNPVNVARGLYLRGKTSALQGHNHQTSEHTETDMNGHITTTWSVGCLSELHPAYMPINKWNHGFAIVEVDGDRFEVRNKRVYKGQVY